MESLFPLREDFKKEYFHNIEDDHFQGGFAFVLKVKHIPSDKYVAMKKFKI